MVPPREDLIACHVLGVMLQDSLDGELASLEDYQGRYPEFASVIEAEWNEVFASQPRDPAPGDNGILSVGSRFGHLLVEEWLGCGGQGEVYRARDERLVRDVALKVLHPLGAISSPARERFEREGRLAARLDHPGVCRVLGSGIEAGIPYLVLELIEGSTLAELLKQLGAGKEPPSWRADVSALRIAIDLASALAYAHGEGIVHRDLKPSNVMVEVGGRSVVLDLGLSKAIDDDRGEITATGDVMGTVGYMAPERWAVGRHARPAPTLDVYSLGVILHQLFAPSEPLPSAHPGPHRSLPKCIPAGLRVIVSRSLQSDPQLRYADAREVRDALLAFESRGRVPGAVRHWMSQWHWSVAVALGLAAAALGAAGLFGMTAFFHRAEAKAVRRATGLDEAARALGAGRIQDAANALEMAGATPLHGAGAWLMGALTTEREASKGPRQDPSPMAGEPSSRSPSTRNPSSLGQGNVSLERVPGRKGIDVVVRYPGTDLEPCRIQYPSREVGVYALSSDALRVAVVAVDSVEEQQHLDLWCGVSGALLRSSALGTDAVAAVAEDSASGWTIGRASGAVEVWDEGSVSLRKDPGIGPIAAVQPRAPFGAWVIAADGRRSWVTSRVACGAHRFQLGAPVRRLAFEAEGQATAAVGRGWRASLDLEQGEVSALARGSVAAQPVQGTQRHSPSAPPEDVIDTLSLANGVTAMLFQDRIEFLEEGSGAAALKFELPGRLTCAAFQASSGLLLIGNQAGYVFAYRQTGWGKVPTHRTPTDGSQRASWLEEATRLGFVSRRTVADGSWEGLRALPDGGGAGQGYLSANGVVPGLPRAWYQHLGRRCQDAVDLDPNDHGAAVGLATVRWRLGELPVLQRQLSLPPLAESTSPTVHLLKALAYGEAGSVEEARAWGARADRAVAGSGGFAGPLYHLLRFEAHADQFEGDREAWAWLTGAIEAGITNPDSWRSASANPPVSASGHGHLAAQMQQQQAAARLLMVPLLEALAASGAGAELHAAANQIVSLAAAALDGERDEALTEVAALAALRVGDLNRAVDLTREGADPKGGTPASKVFLLIRALVEARRGNTEAAAIAFNRATVGALRAKDAYLAAELLELEVREQLAIGPP